MSDPPPFEGVPEDAPEFIKAEFEALKDLDDGTFYPDETGEEREMSAPFDTGAEYTDGEAAFHAMYEDVLWEGENGAVEKQLLNPVRRMPENVRERLIEAIDEGALFEDMETLSDEARRRLRDFLVEQARGDGWSIGNLAERLRAMDPSLSEYDAERISRTETQSLVTHAREEWYTEDFEEDAVFMWQGPQDHRTTDACRWLKEKTNPRYGGTPRSLEEMRDLVAEASEKFFPDLNVRRWTPHPNCRHTLIRVPPDGQAPLY